MASTDARVCTQCSFMARDYGLLKEHLARFHPAPPPPGRDELRAAALLTYEALNDLVYYLRAQGVDSRLEAFIESADTALAASRAALAGRVDDG
jgi:hypothetical protein